MKALLTLCFTFIICINCQTIPEQSIFVPVAANAELRSESGRGGWVEFFQPNFPNQPLLCHFNLFHLRPGSYFIQIHFFGDTSDGCKQAPGNAWQVLHEFEVGELDEGEYKNSLKEPNIDLNNIERGILGRAISLVKKGRDSEYDDEIIGCNVVGLAGEERAYEFQRAQLRITNPVTGRVFRRRFYY